MYERPLGSQKAKILVALTAHAERIIRSIDALEVATEGGLNNDLPVKIDPAGIEQCLSRLGEGILTNDFSDPGTDLPSAMRFLNAKIANLRDAQAFRDVSLQDLIRTDAVCLALRSIATALAETQATARGTTQ